MPYVAGIWLFATHLCRVTSGHRNHRIGLRLRRATARCRHVCLRRSLARQHQRLTVPEEKVNEFGKSVPLERPAQPVELAPPYVMLASDESSYVTGAYIPVTGGKPTL